MLNCCRLFRRLFYCVLLAALLPAAQAAPTKTVVNEGLFGSKTGPQKKEAALSFISAALSLTEAVSQRDIVDEQKFREGLGKTIDGVVQCLNASTWAKAK